MKVAVIIPSFPRYSETFVYREVQGLMDLGMDLKICSFVSPTVDELTKMSPVARRLSQQTTYIHNRELLYAIPRLLRSLTALRTEYRLRNDETVKRRSSTRLLRAHKLSELFGKWGIDHIHSHWPYGAELALHVHHLTGIPFSVSIHAHEVAHDGGHFRAVFEEVKFATFCNRAAMDYLLDRLPAEARRRSSLLYHGVDLSMFPSLPLPETLPPLRIISSGRLTKTKGFDRLIRALGQAVGKGMDVKLTIVGDGSERERLDQLCRDLGLTDRVVITGWVPHEAVRDHYRRSHVFALLADTNYNDGLPNVVLEAGASGRPIILSPLPAAQEAVVPGENGFIVSAPDALEELVEHWQQFIRRPELIHDMGDRSRAIASERFDARKHLETLKNLIERGQSSR